MKSNTTLENDLRAVGHDVEGLLSSVGRDSSSSVARAYESARDRLADVDERLRRNARDAALSAEDYVHHNPWRSIGLGALVGLLAGVLIARR